METVEGNLVEKEICMMIPDTYVFVESGVSVAPVFELLAVSFYREINGWIGEFYC
jgi:hypothetical protein